MELSSNLLAAMELARGAKLASVLAKTALPAQQVKECETAPVMTPQPPEQALPVPEVAYRFIQSDEHLVELLEAATAVNHFAIDTETTGLDPLMGKIRLMQIAIPDHPVFVVDLWAISVEGRALIQKVLSLPALKIFHNAKFDLKFLKRAGFNVVGPFFDTMLAAYMLEIGRDDAKMPSLKSIAAKYLQVDLPKEQQQADWSGSISPEMIEYSA
ncbi:MAG: hypothetical protein HQM09_24160, partial [Candidatus Riflebacteria bacterium]|nr:hypothetical protein [Candidatus Riflebacteria bacterium]